MPTVKYTIKLREEEKRELKKIIKSRKTKPRGETRARILLLSDEYLKSNIQRVAQAVMCSKSMVNSTRKKCIEEGVIECLIDKRRNRVYERLLDAKAEAMLVTLVCSKAPEGSSKWTMQLLADELVELNYVDSISDETVRRTLKKMRLSLG